MVCWKYPIKLLFAAAEVFFMCSLIDFSFSFLSFYNNYRGKIIPADLEAKILEAKQKVYTLEYI